MFVVGVAVVGYNGQEVLEGQRVGRRGGHGGEHLYPHRTVASLGECVEDLGRSV